MKETIKHQLEEVLHYTGWTQEQLAYQLGVPARTVFAWLNQQTIPRLANQRRIEDIYREVVGQASVHPEALEQAKHSALTHHMTAHELVANRELLDALTLQMTYHTNSIEGSTMTVDDVRTVLDDDQAVLANKTAIEQLEARNHRTALNYLLDQLNNQGGNFHWTVDLIQQLHLRLMNSVVSNAGIFRRYGVRVLGASVPRVNHASVPDKLAELIDFINKPSDDPIGRIAYTHARYELIHPFSDGNGRTGRLIMLGQALQDKLMPPLVTRERRQVYYRYLDQANRDEDYRLLELFIAESMLAADRLLNH